jgi:diguanylate cyclase (GGDEF)-like protein/PAS domain S-box-containing protein
MSDLTGDSKQSFTASDILSPESWHVARRLPSVGLQAATTKIAVDFQTLAAESAQAVLLQNLEILRSETQSDAAFVASYNAAGTVIERVDSAEAVFGACEPARLRGTPLGELPALVARLTEARSLEIRDTGSPGSSFAAEGAAFARAGLGAVIMVGFRVAGRAQGFLALATSRPGEGFAVDVHLALKLLATSLSSGLGRLALDRELAHVREREALWQGCANDGLWDYDAATNRTWFSPRWRAMLGYDDDELADGIDWNKLVHPDDRSRVSQLIRDHVAGKSEIFESTHRMLRRDGEWLWVVSRAKAFMDESGRLRRLAGVEHDITERKLYEEALFREKESAQITLRAIGDGVITTDEHSRIEYLNPVAEGLTGWRVEDAMGHLIEEVFRAFHEETCEPLENPLSQAIRRDRAVKSQRPMLLIRSDGNELYVESTASPIKDGSSVVTGGVLVFHDVTESRELNRRLSYHASHDILTGLVNRREFEHRLERALKSSGANETSYVVCYVDLDQFKIINDTCGHAAGDAVLGQAGTLLKSKVRWRDTLSRIGGDEFGILLESCSLDEALRTAETLREAVRNFRFTWEDRTFRLGASIGVVPITADTGDVASLMSAAESACQAAKEFGRNRVHSFEENDIDLMRRRREMQWASRINAALEEGRFDIYRQLIRPLQGDEDGLHYEILLRMRDEAGKIISPDNFIAAAERYGLMPTIDRWVIQHTFRWLVTSADERQKLAMCAINLSGQSLGDDKFLPYVIEEFHSSGLDASKICFEITETAAIASFSQANRFIRALKELGCKFSLDDFGTGMSSFGYLKHFPVDYLKIDGSFVKEILRDPIDREMVRSINEIGHLTGKKTIAEFAENDEIIEMLRNLGVDYAQGYGVSMPQNVLGALPERVRGGA